MRNKYKLRNVESLYREYLDDADYTMEALEKSVEKYFDKVGKQKHINLDLVLSGHRNQIRVDEKDYSQIVNIYRGLDSYDLTHDEIMKKIDEFLGIDDEEVFKVEKTWGDYVKLKEENGTDEIRQDDEEFAGALFIRKDMDNKTRKEIAEFIKENGGVIIYEEQTGMEYDTDDIPEVAFF